MCVKYHYDKVSVNSFSGKLSHLKSEIHARMGIPVNIQKLYYQNRLLTEKNISAIPSGCTLMLSLGLSGGSDNCDICYENGVFTCSDCQGKIYCATCCKNVHKHPSRLSHNPCRIATSPPSSENNSESDSVLTSAVESNETNDFDVDNTDPWDDDFTDSPNTSQAFIEASMVMTLAEKFNMTRFRQYQKEAITALLSGQDCLIVQPTGSGKSMCFQFPAVHQNKISVVVTPTISLMQDHVKNCEEKGIKAAYLGSAQ